MPTWKKDLYEQWLASLTTKTTETSPSSSKDPESPGGSPKPSIKGEEPTQSFGWTYQGGITQSVPNWYVQAAAVSTLSSASQADWKYVRIEPGEFASFDIETVDVEIV